MLAGKRILLIIGGGIAAYKALDLIRRLKSEGARCAGPDPRGEEFVTPLSVAALAADRRFSAICST
jgi:phosphopantothenoylcysteine decarboxylase/phosphopantothenate--cysteine ligase